jgi:hypothetical protein
MIDRDADAPWGDFIKPGTAIGNAAKLPACRYGLAGL